MNSIISFVFINGEFRQELSDGIPMSFRFSCEKNQMVLCIPQNIIINSVLHFKYLNGCDGLERHWTVEENAAVNIMEEFVFDKENSYKTDTALHVKLHKNAKMKYHKIQNEYQAATHQGLLSVEQHEASQINMFFADCGGFNSRSEVKVSLAEKDAVCHMHGIYFLNRDDQVVDNKIHVDHIAELGTSSMVFKGVLDKKSKANFNGSVHVHDKAKRTSAHQQNNNLLLSSLSEVSTKPQLEVYADDVVKCTHGATVGQLDQDALFYLRSRGIDESTALKMLTEAFVAEIMENIEDPMIRTYIRNRVVQHAVI